jgi:hypothetical protein
MSKREEQRIAKLIRKHGTRAAPQGVDRSAQYDDTLRGRPPDEDPKTRRLFREMRRREF